MRVARCRSIGPVSFGSVNVRRKAIKLGGRNAGAGSCHEAIRYELFHDGGASGLVFAAFINSLGRKGSFDISTPELIGLDDSGLLYMAGGSGYSGVVPTGPVLRV